MIGLVMIVRNEAHVLRRCLKSVKPFIDWWTIADTGSTDDTMGVIEDVLDDLPGKIVQHEWVDFAHNRNAVLDEAREFGDMERDYVLTIDADEALRDLRLKETTKSFDGYFLPVEYDGTTYERLALLRLGAPWRWVGPVHEYLELEGAATMSLPSPTIKVYHEGARSKDPETYAKDARLLERALVDDPDNPRWQFYLAESYRFAGETSAAGLAYETRARNENGWWQERWFAGYQLGHLAEMLGMDPTRFWLNAYDLDPRRAEPLVELARWERGKNRFALAILYADAALLCTAPTTDALFVNTAAYDWRGYDELAISSYWAGDPETALAAAILAVERGPDDPRLHENVRLCREALG